MATKTASQLVGLPGYTPRRMPFCGADRRAHGGPAFAARSSPVTCVFFPLHGGPSPSTARAWAPVPLHPVSTPPVSARLGRLPGPPPGGPLHLPHLEANQALLPGVDLRQVEVFQGLPTEPEVEPIWRHSELEGHGLVRFRHPGGCPAPGREREGAWVATPAPTELVAAQSAAQAPSPGPQPGQRPANPRARVHGRLRCTGAGAGVGRASKTPGSRGQRRAASGQRPGAPTASSSRARRGPGGAPAPTAGARTSAPPPRVLGRPGGPRRPRRHSRLGSPLPAARPALWPVSPRPSGRPPPRPPRNPTPSPKFGSRKQMRGGDRARPRPPWRKRGGRQPAPR